MADCTCSRLSVGGGLNWNPDCAAHGLTTDWYRSPEQVERRRVQSERLRDLQRQAREARERSKARHPSG